MIYDETMAREDPQLKIRLPEALKERVENVAKSNNRTMNAEIVARLDMSFELAEAIPKAQYDALVAHARGMEKVFEAGGEIQGRLHRIMAIERSLSLMFAKSVIGLGQRLRRVLDALDDSKESDQLKAMEPEVIDAMQAAERVLEYAKSEEGLPWAPTTNPEP